MLPFLLCLTIQSQTLLQLVIPQPTGMNGYEEYLQAADVLQSREYIAFKTWRTSLKKTPGSVAPPQGLVSNSSELAQRRYEVEHFGHALQLLSKGNAKATDRGTLDVFAESTALRDLSQLAVDSAYVNYSKGNWTAGTNQLLQLLVFGSNVSKELTMGQIVGWTIFKQAFPAFDAHKSQWSVNDCDRVTALAKELLDGKPSVALAMEKERAFMERNVDQFVSGTGPPPDPKTASEFSLKLDDRIKSLSSTGRSQVSDLVHRQINDAFEMISQRIQKPEMEWFSESKVADVKPEPNSLNTIPQIARAVLHDALLPTPELLATELTTRTQFRLLRLHAEIQKFRWQYNRLPNRLSECASAEDCYDPLTGIAFDYTAKGSSYKVSSQGNSATGEIELTYFRPKKRIE